MEVLFEILFGVLVEGLLELLAGLLVHFGYESVAHSVRCARKANPLLAAIGLVIIGATAGFLTCWLLPGPLVAPSRYAPWPALFMAPIGAGAVMHVVGRWWRRRGGDPSMLATFWGGVLFAFAMGAIRVLCLRRFAG